MKSKSFHNKFKRFEQPLLSLNQVSQFHNATTQVLHHISLNIMPGEIVYISGESGAGKTTLLKVCSLLLAPSQGEVSFRGKLFINYQNVSNESSVNPLESFRKTQYLFRITRYIKILLCHSVSLVFALQKFIDGLMKCFGKLT